MDPGDMKQLVAEALAGQPWVRPEPR
jgi:hypothetical protein